MSRNPSKVHRSVGVFAPSLSDILFVLVFMLALAFGSQMLSIDSDLGRHLTIGDYILDNRMIPTHDLFSHTLSNEPRPPYEWLSQILFALANRLWGLDGVILLTASIIATTFYLMFIFSNRRCKSPLIAFSITLLALGASSLHWLPRPHIITFLFLAIWLENLEKLRRGKPVELLTFLLIMVFWANLHGGFVFGILAWCAYFAGWIWEKWQSRAADQTGWRLLLVGVGALVTSVITPDLWHNWEAVLNNRSSFILSRTAETMPPNLTAPSVFPFTVLLALTLILFLLNYKALSASHFFLLTGLGMTALLMARNIPLFVIACTPIVSALAKASLTRWNAWNRIEEQLSSLDRQARWPIIPLTVALLMVTFFAGHYLYKHKTMFQFNPQVFPVQAMDWLKTHHQSGNMFNEFNWGGYILYRVWPPEQVFLDSQSDFYGEALMREYEQITSIRGDWENLLESYQVRWAILPSDGPLAKELEKQGWIIGYQDQTAAILVKP
jgi:hypothetical protein